MKASKQSWGFPGGTVENLPANADWGSVLGLGRCPGEGSGNPLQYSCLVNPTDRGARWAIVCGVGKRVRHDFVTEEQVELVSFYFYTEISGVGPFYTLRQCQNVIWFKWHVWAHFQLILSLPETLFLVNMVDIIRLSCLIFFVESWHMETCF